MDSAGTQEMSLNQQPRGTMFAVALIVAGAILFFDNLGILPFDNIGAYWPLAFVIYGIGMIARRTNATSIIWATALIAFGAILTMGNLGIVRARFSVAWPILLIAFGVTALVQRAHWSSRLPKGDAWAPGQWGRYQWQDQIFATKREWRAWRREQRRLRWQGHFAWPNQAEPGSDRFVRENAVFTSIKRRLDGREVQGGELAAVFGSIEIDFTGATIPLSAPESDGGNPARRAEFEVSAVFGSVEIRVPANWRVLREGAGVFGSYEDRTIPYRPEPGVEPPTLALRGDAVFGSVTIEN